MSTTTYVRGAERMLTAVRLAPEGVHVRFADDRQGWIPLPVLKLGDTPTSISLPNPHVIELHLANDTVEEVPWDFARHYADEDYRARSKDLATNARRRFSEHLRTLRSDRGLSQRALAVRSGVSRVSIARMETGHQLPRYGTLARIARGLGLPVERLITP